MNIHSPARGADESRDDYKKRRAASKAAVRAMTLAGIGDQHKAPSSREQLRDQQRRNGNGPKGTFGTSLMAHFSRRAFHAKAKAPKTNAAA